MGKEYYFNTYTSDFSLFSFVQERAKGFKSRSEYILELIKADRDGLISWGGKEIQREPIIELLKRILEALGVDKSPEIIEFVEKAEKGTLRISEDLSEEEIVKILTDEGIL